MAKQRLDTLLVDRGLLPTRSAAQTSIRAGLVRIGTGGERALAPGQKYDTTIELEVEEGRRYVSRGGLKLEPALDQLEIDPTGLDCLDLGASTGGFTDCMLKRGAARVVAVDVGRGQLDHGLRQDERVIEMDGVNARELQPGDLPFPPELTTIDLSFISLTKVLPAVASLIDPGARVLAMVKPQFELGKGRVKGGVVRKRPERLEAVHAVVAAGAELGLGLVAAVAAGVPGPKGNQEVFALLVSGAECDDPDPLIEAAVE